MVGATLMSYNVLFYRTGTFGHGSPAKHCKNSTYNRTYNHNPEIAPGFRAEYSRTETARGVNRAVINRNSNDIHKSESKTDCEAGKLAIALVGVGGTEDNKHEEECEQAFCQQSHTGRSTGLKHIGGKISIRSRCAAEIEIRGKMHECKKKTGTYCCTEKLEHNIAHAFLTAHTASQIHGQRHCGVYVATRDIANGIAKAHQNQAKA